MLLKETKFGKSTFTDKDIFVGEKIIEFVGDYFTKSQIPPILCSQDDRYTQIDYDLYIGPSGDFDDYADHSCDPNSGLKFLNDGLWLVAIKNISKGEKLTWDYSTFMNENDFEMECKCGSEKCRKIIRDFKWLDEETKIRYKKLGIVPKFCM